MVNSEGRTTATKDDISRVISRMAEEGFRSLLEAVSARNPRAVIKAIQHLREGPQADASVGVCVAVGRTSAKWLRAASLLARGSAEDAASSMGMSPHQFKAQLWAPAKRWGQGRLVRLVRAMAVAERAAKGGSNAPWVKVEATLVAACSWPEVASPDAVPVTAP